MKSYGTLSEYYRKSPDELMRIASRLAAMRIIFPSWTSLNAGTRFGRVLSSDAAKDVWESIDKDGVIHALTGIAPGIVWGSTADNDVARINALTKKNGLYVDTVHAYFTGEANSYGSVANVKKAERDKSLAEIRDCIEVMRGTGAKRLSLWFRDGTNYPGQADFTKRYERMLGVLKEAYALLDSDMTMLIEYKLFEPAMYHTDVADWGTAVALCKESGPQAKVIMDLGHHAQGTNIPATLSSIIRAGKLGAIHFNDSKYADDDLIVGALDPFRLFLIFHELLTHEHCGRLQADQTPLIIDQSLVVEEKLPGMLYTVGNMQTAFAKALLVDREALAEKQDANDIIGSTRVLREAFEYDVRPLINTLRENSGLPLDPFAAL